jgi:hypothetical protein
MLEKRGALTHATLLAICSAAAATHRTAADLTVLLSSNVPLVWKAPLNKGEVPNGQFPQYSSPLVLPDGNLVLAPFGLSVTKKVGAIHYAYVYKVPFSA